MTDSGMIPDDLRGAVTPGAGGLPKVVLRAADGARAELYLHGAHVTSWVPAGGGDERLFLSAAAEFRDGAAIRGGVPVIFPQFAGMGPLPKHGFARTTAWSLAGVADDGATASATLRLGDTAATRALWPHAFAAELTVTVGGPSLVVRLAVANMGRDDAFDFTAALHTYLRVADASRAALRGLGGARYRDSAAGGVERVQEEPELHVRGEVDRIYLGAPASLELAEPGRVTHIASSGFPDVVVWNPGPTKGAALGDMEPDGASRMLCVEAAAVGAPVRLATARRWEGTQTLTAL
ncbi:MAG TPA: D-hexose-6-phosphate mutarotase [Gemmatimonadaceae bacterium]|nr:D-hexose-6-phosphate mutarotase [Gemmatimonadaceae bacterium]